MFSLNIKPQYIPARYFSFCVLLTVLLVTLSIRSLQGELFITDAQYMVAAGRWIIANGHLPTIDPLSIHSELTYICQQYPICILVAVLYDTFGEMSVRLFFRCWTWWRFSSFGTKLFQKLETAFFTVLFHAYSER